MKRRPTANEIAGMTMNERLFACGLTEEFDLALGNDNREAFIEVVAQLGFSKEEACTYAATHFERLQKRTK